ncbi:MAG: cystathionine beta-lyase [Candidatus Azotimanducaceae bacterium]|jgi:cystathionine beta-lyase
MAITTFDEAIDRTMSFSSRWGGKRDCLALTTGDADFRMPAAIEEALTQRVAHGVLGYDTIPDSLTDMLVQRLADRHHWDVAQEAIVYLPGVVQGINFVCRTFTRPGDAIVTEVPIYYPFMDAISNSDREQLSLSPIQRGTRWEIDFDRLREYLARAETKLFLLCNPHNPLGRVWRKNELEQLAQLCLDHGVLICSDEIHCDLLFEDHEHVSISALDPSVAKQTITLMSPSKAFAMSGLGGAWAVIPDPAVRAKFEGYAVGLVPNLNVMALVAMAAAYRDCESWRVDLLSYLTENRQFVFDRLQGLAGIETSLPEAAYFLWLNFQGTGLNRPCQTLLAGGVELSDGAVFGADGYLRLNFASPRAVLQEACERIQSKLSH